MIFGNEKFLLDNDYDLPAAGVRASTQRHLPSLSGSSPTHSHQSTQQAYFLATNSSVFERNPFQDFTTNKLNDLLQGKSRDDVVRMREEALRFQEKLERGFINRLEKKEQLSPSSAYRRKFELEKWVSAE